MKMAICGSQTIILKSVARFVLLKSDFFSSASYFIKNRCDGVRVNSNFISKN